VVSVDHMVGCVCVSGLDVLSSILSKDLLLMLGDLNAHVGVWDRSSELWSDMLGCFGIDNRNQDFKIFVN